MARREETSVAASGSSATLCFGGDEPSAPVPAGCNADNVRHERNFYKFGATCYGQRACNYFGPVAEILGIFRASEIEVLDRVLDKGIVIDASALVSLVGIDLT